MSKQETYQLNQPELWFEVRHSTSWKYGRLVESLPQKNVRESIAMLKTEIYGILCPG